MDDYQILEAIIVVTSEGRMGDVSGEWTPGTSKEMNVLPLELSGRYTGVILLLLFSKRTYILCVQILYTYITIKT